MPQAPLDVRHVILPWARPEQIPTAADDADTGARVTTDTFDLRVQRDRLAIRSPAGRASAEPQSAAQSLGIIPPLLAHGLPFKPHPSVPDADRVRFEPAALMSAAVALDILSTRGRAIGARSTVLADLVEVLLSVGELGGVDEAAQKRLLRHAESEVGHSRAALSRHIARAMTLPPRPTDSADEATAVGAAHASTPRAVARAVQRILRAADVAIHAARLRLEGEEAVQYRQA